MRPGDQVRKGGAERLQLRDAHAQPLRHRQGDRARPLLEGPATRGECHPHRSFVLAVAMPFHQARCGKPLDDGRYRRRVELEEPAELRDRKRFLLPERDHDQILRVGEAEWLEQRSVKGDHAPRGHGERKTHLLVQRQVVSLLRTLFNCRHPSRLVAADAHEEPRRGRCVSLQMGFASTWHSIAMTAAATSGEPAACLDHSHVVGPLGRLRLRSARAGRGNLGHESDDLFEMG